MDMNVLMGSTIGLGLACGVLYHLWTVEKHNNEILTINNNTLISSIEEQQSTIATFGELKEADNKRLKVFQNSIAASQKETQDANNKINIMRVTEHVKALQEPFQRGVAANIRFGNIFMRIENGNITGGFTTDVAPADSSQGT